VAFASSYTILDNLEAISQSVENGVKGEV